MVDKQFEKYYLRSNSMSQKEKTTYGLLAWTGIPQKRPQWEMLPKYIISQEGKIKKRWNIFQTH